MYDYGQIVHRENMRKHCFHEHPFPFPKQLFVVVQSLGLGVQTKEPGGKLPEVNWNTWYMDLPNLTLSLKDCHDYQNGSKWTNKGIFAIAKVFIEPLRKLCVALFPVSSK